MVEYLTCNKDVICSIQITSSNRINKIWPFSSTAQSFRFLRVGVSQRSSRNSIIQWIYSLRDRAESL